MNASVPTQPDNYPTVVPYISVRGAAGLLDFMVDVFGAVERGRFPTGTARWATPRSTWATR